MRVAVVGLGIQGAKRTFVAGADVVARVDPAVADAGYRDLTAVPAAAYTAALLCVPDQAKLGLMECLLGQGKHVLVEKPLIATPARFDKLAVLAERHGVTCYTAYNHRFEPHVAEMKRLLDARALGRIFTARLFYGNGTARNVAASPWRDTASGVIRDLGAHLLDLVLYFWGERADKVALWSATRLENKAFDHAAFGFAADPPIQMEVSLVSWRNAFTIDVFGERGSLHISSLCKWGPSTLTRRTRVLPSGVPEETRRTTRRKDRSWAEEYAHFKELCAAGRHTLDRDRWVSAQLTALAVQAGLDAP